MKTFSVMLKDLRILIKDRGTLFQLFLLPLLFILVFSGALGGIGKGTKDTRIQLVVVNLDEGAVAQTFLSKVDAAGGVIVQLYDQAEAQNLLKKNKLSRVLTIPADFSAAVSENRPVTLHLVNSPDAQPDETQAVQLVLEGVAADMTLESQIVASLQQMGQMQASAPQQAAAFSTDRIVAQAHSQFEQSQTQPLISVVQSVPTQEPGSETTPDLSQVSVPGFTVLFVFLTAQTTARSIHDEKQIGSFRRLMASPLSKVSLLTGKVLPNFITALVQIIVIFAFGNLGMRLIGLTPLSLGNSPLGLVLTALMIALCSSTFGVVIAALARTENQIGGMGTLLLWGMGLLGGCIAPLFLLERFLPAPILMIVPHYWANRALDDRLLRGLGLGDIWIDLAALLGFSLLFLVVGAWRFRFDK